MLIGVNTPIHVTPLQNTPIHVTRLRSSVTSLHALRGYIGGERFVLDSVNDRASAFEFFSYSYQRSVPFTMPSWYCGLLSLTPVAGLFWASGTSDVAQSKMTIHLLFCIQQLSGQFILKCNEMLCHMNSQSLNQPFPCWRFSVAVCVALYTDNTHFYHTQMWNKLGCGASFLGTRICIMKSSQINHFTVLAHKITRTS